MISQQIQAIIDEVKQQSNSLERNKIVSHLEDAKAWAIRQEVQVPKRLLETEPYVVGGCTCLPGSRDKTCPTHGG